MRRSLLAETLLLILAASGSEAPAALLALKGPQARPGLKALQAPPDRRVLQGPLDRRGLQDLQEFPQLARISKTERLKAQASTSTATG